MKHRHAELMKLSANDATIRFQYYRFGAWCDCPTDVNWSLDAPMRVREYANQINPHKSVLLALAEDSSLIMQYRDPMTGIWSDQENQHFIPNAQYRIKPPETAKAVVGQYMRFSDEDELFHVLVDAVWDDGAHFSGYVIQHMVTGRAFMASVRKGEHNKFDTVDFTNSTRP